MKKINITLILFFLFSMVTLAQSGQSYIVTVDKDTIYGELTSQSERVVKFKIDGKRKSFGLREVFRAYDADKDMLYAPTHIKDGKIKIAGSKPKKYRIYDRARTEGILTFMEVLADGEIIVYCEAGGPGGMHMNHMTGTMSSSGNIPPSYFALKKSKNEIIQLKRIGGFLTGGMSNERILENIGDFMDDAPHLLAELQKEKKFTNDIFINYIKKYNAFKKSTDNEAVDYGTKLF